jgi:hypothetical protein
MTVEGAPTVRTILVLIAFVAWKMSKEPTFLEIEPLDLLVTKFSTLWYMNDMLKQWKLNGVFHAYYQQLKVSIDSFPCMTPRTLNQYRPLAKFHVDPHFIYITTRRDERKEELQSYYSLTDKDMEKITNEWPKEFCVLVNDVKLSDPDIIGSPLVTQFEHAGQSSAKEKKRKEEVHNIETDEEDNASEENGPGSPIGGGGDEVNQEVGGKEGEKKGEGEGTPSKYLPTKIETLKKRKVSP